ncbi:molybdenum cofactor guanylyltransferase [Marinomonas sp. 2405UD68-3]|uniref:molybdenum cofactor guanylyltransferase n=1 Tax=Marinomonas sp. 2405UD68-3 TaxID=3391835 RepID=UPI0039C9EEFB
MSTIVIDQSVLRCVGVVLAGGQATRMQGKNKALQQYKGQPLYRYVFDAMQEVGLSLKMNVNSDQERFMEKGVDVFPDDKRFNSCGPLSGVATGLSLYKEKYTHVVFSPCDTPLVPSSVFALLVEKSKSRPQSAFYIETSSGAQPLHAVLPIAVLDQLITFLNGKQYRVMAFYKAIGAESIYWNDETLFKNINYLKELV